NCCRSWTLRFRPPSSLTTAIRTTAMTEPEEKMTEPEEKMTEPEGKPTLMRKFWLWRCDHCGLLAYPPDGRPDDEPDIVCVCWSRPRWVRYLALHPDTPDEKDARRRARASSAL